MTEYKRTQQASGLSTWKIGEYELKYDTIIFDDGSISWIKEDKYGNREIFEPKITTENGYKRVRLPLKNGGAKRMYVHQIMATIFYSVTTRENGLAVHHINGDKSDNRVDNLQIMTAKENVLHYFHKEAQQQSEQNFDIKKIKLGVHLLKVNGKVEPDYSITRDGVVSKWNDDTQDWEPLKQYVANINTPSNITVTINNINYSLPRLVAENFMNIDYSRKFRVFQIDKGNGFENNFSVENLTVVYQKDVA